ncbi:MAG: DUF4091 domain-containing protein [Clostridia bacterium]|nr:DUF4091 domain-containing protein [Clostridia bacterium]
MELWTKSISHTVFRHTKNEENDIGRIVLHSARNASVAAQILLRDVSRAFHVDGCRVSGLPDGVTAEVCAQGYEIYNDGLPYPDKLLPRVEVDVLPNATQGFVVTFRVGADAPVGVYTVYVHLPLTQENGNKAEPSAMLILHVHAATLPEPKDSAFGHEYFFDIHASDEKLISYAKAMKALRVNSLYLDAIPLLCRGGSKMTGENTWAFDYSALDAFVKLFLEHGSFCYITLVNIVTPVTGNWMTYIDENGRPAGVELKEDEKPAIAEAFARAYYGGMAEHFAEMGWRDMLRIHLEDEPHTEGSWLWARAICHEVAPGVPCTEPIDTKGMGRTLGGACDIPVPRLEVYDHDREYYTKVTEDGGKVWCYSCCYPIEHWWLNKFIDLPTRYARMIKWACYAQGITGFLHWGFNFWSGESAYGLNPNVRFKGDGFIVYPADDGVLMSGRGLSTTVGIEEWELLSMLGKKDAAAAKALARRVARTFRDFTDDPDVLDQTRAELFALIDALYG